MPDFALVEQLDQAIDGLLAGATQPGPADPALAGLLDIAGTLRDLPDDRFKTRLGAELRAESQRRATMTATATTVIRKITPFISVAEGAKLIDFMKHTFGAEETSRHPHGPGDGFVAVVKIGDSDVLIMGDESLRGQEMLAALHVYVKDCDAAYQRALDSGAVTLGPPGGVGEPADRPYGERAAFVEDPFGNHWYIATRLGPNYVPKGQRHVNACLHPPKSVLLIDFLKRAFGAEEVGPHHMEEGRVAHAFVRIGDALIELADRYEESRPFGLYLYTDDVDAVYHRAMAAGAVSIAPPGDRDYGDRMAILQDPAGNFWFPAKSNPALEG